MPNLSELYRWTSRTCGRRRGKCTTALLFISKIPSLFWKCCKHNMRIRNSSIYKKFSGQNVWTSYTGNNPILFAFVGVHILLWAISYFHIDIKSSYYLGTLSSLRVWLGRLSYDYRWPMGRIQPRISISSVVFICICYLPVPSNQIPIKHNQHISKRNYTIGHLFDNTCTITPKIN